MLETSARLLRLLSLFQGRRLWSGPDLAGRLEVTSRTLRRDVDKLRSLGYPIHSTAGAEGGYRFGGGSTMPPLLFDDEEAVAVALGLGCAAASIEGMEEASIRALSKIEQMLPQRLSHRVSALQGMIVTPSGSRPSVSARLLSGIAAACRDQETLRFRYRDHGGTAKAHARSSRTAWVRPHWPSMVPWSPGTPIARIGGPFVLTVSRAGLPTGPAFRHGSPRHATWPRT